MQGDLHPREVSISVLTDSSVNKNKEFSDIQVNFLAESMNLRIEDFPNDTLPKWIVPLERMFDIYEMYKGKPIIDQYYEAFEFNISSKNDQRMLKKGKGTTHTEMENIISLIRDYKDIFAWTYDDMKAYKGDIIQHSIPLKEGAKPFRQNLRHINPKLPPKI